MAKSKEIKVINYITLRDSVYGDSETVRMDELTADEKEKIFLRMHNNHMKAQGYELVNKDVLLELTDEQKDCWRKRFTEINKRNL